MYPGLPRLGLTTVGGLQPVVLTAFRPDDRIAPSLVQRIVNRSNGTAAAAARAVAGTSDHPLHPRTCSAVPATAPDRRLQVAPTQLRRGA